MEEEDNNEVLSSWNNEDDVDLMETAAFEKCVIKKLCFWYRIASLTHHD